MSAQYLTIDRKHRRPIYLVASMEDFTCTTGDPVSADIVCARPNISLYCLDDETQRAIFVELPVGVDLSAAPFVYQMQYDQAERLIAMPYDVFRDMGHALPAIDNPIVVYNTGRCGSTLVSHLLNEAGYVASLSEPDVASQFVHLRHIHGQGDAALRDLLDCTIRILFKPGAFAARTRYALKLRTDGIQLMDLFQATFLKATSLYLYRDAIGFVASFCRVVQRFQGPESMPVTEYLAGFGEVARQDLTYQMAYLDEGTTELSLAQQFTLMWLNCLEWYLTQYARGIPVLAVLYDDLNAHREQVAAAILNYCGLPSTQASQLLGVFTRDAQAGTVMARDKADEGNQLRLTDQQLQEMANILRRHPVVKEFNFVLPGTLRL